jgi:hypothetical protein
MLKTIATGVTLGCVAAQTLILSSNPAASLTITRCTPSTGGALVCTTCPVHGPGIDVLPAPPPGTLASLLAEGYEITSVREPGGGGIVVLRKRWSYQPTYICNREPIGSPADESFKTCKYDQVLCSLAPDRYP